MNNTNKKTYILNFLKHRRCDHDEYKVRTSRNSLIQHIIVELKHRSQRKYDSDRRNASQEHSQRVYERIKLNDSDT